MENLVMPCQKNGLSSIPTLASGTMLDHSTFHKFLSKGNSSKRLDFFKCHKEQIHSYLIGFIESEPPTLYREFILKNAEGQGRVRVYLGEMGSDQARTANGVGLGQKQGCFSILIRCFSSRKKWIKV